MENQGIMTTNVLIILAITVLIGLGISQCSTRHVVVDININLTPKIFK